MARAAEGLRTGGARSLFRRAFGLSDRGDDGALRETGVGRLLCATRMRLGKDLQQIARVLHIRYTYLVAIEDGRYEDLPGQAYAIGFVRAYADHLDLDGDEIVRRYKEESTGLKRKAALDFPIPAPDSGVPSGIALLAAIVLGMAVYGVWYALSGPGRTVAVVQEVPARLAPPADVPDAAAPPAAPGEATEEVASEAPQPPSPPMPPEPQAVSEAARLAEPPDPAKPPADVLELRAKVDSWIQVRQGDVLMLTRLLRKGEVYRVPEQPGLTLMTGNAGGIEVLVNGELMAPLGEPGAVASGIPLESRHFKTGG
jgi:cytoskeleton protein RodZ